MNTATPFRYIPDLVSLTADYLERTAKTCAVGLDGNLERYQVFLVDEVDQADTARDGVLLLQAMTRFPWPSMKCCFLWLPQDDHTECAADIVDGENIASFLFDAPLSWQTGLVKVRRLAGKIGRTCRAWSRPGEYVWALEQKSGTFHGECLKAVEQMLLSEAEKWEVLPHRATYNAADHVVSTAGDFALTLGTELCMKYAALAAPTGYRARLTVPPFGRGVARRMSTPQLQVLATINLDRLWSSSQEVGPSLNIRRPHTRRGHIKYQWARAGINRFTDLPSSPAERMRLAVDRDVKRVYCPPHWAGPRQFKLDGMTFDIDTSEFELPSLTTPKETAP
ncbi:MAG: hypothetical protein SF069_03110 [Phycisphaerae bacterium]|nr:hypothetical protein [Phycisphaerae bacterium]